MKFFVKVPRAFLIKLIIKNSFLKIPLGHFQLVVPTGIYYRSTNLKTKTEAKMQIINCVCTELIKIDLISYHNSYNSL